MFYDQGINCSSAKTSFKRNDQSAGLPKHGHSQGDGQGLPARTELYSLFIV